MNLRPGFIDKAEIKELGFLVQLGLLSRFLKKCLRKKKNIIGVHLRENNDTDRF